MIASGRGSGGPALVEVAQGGHALPMRWLLALASLALAAPGSGAWEPRFFRGIDRHTHYEVVEAAEGPAFRAESACSASALGLRLRGIDLRRTPRLSWRWRVERGPGGADEQSRAGDDFAARVYVLFPFDPAHASLWERLRRRLLASVYGEELPGRALCYVWARRLPAGSRWASPYTEDTRMLALRSGSGAVESQGWKRETVDVAADYRAWTGEAPGEPVGVAIMTDSDNGCGSATAWYADFAFLSADETAAEAGNSGAGDVVLQREPAPRPAHGGAQ